MRWSSTAAASLVRDVLVPAGGLYGMLFDRPLSALTVGAYLAMMGVPVGGYIDRRRKDRAANGTPEQPPP